MNEKEIKQQIRKLRKLKRDTPKKTDERRQINKQIRDLKIQLSLTLPKTIESSPKRTSIIQEIYKYNPLLERIGLNMNKYTDEQLTFHLTRLKRR
jgi:hypothetical protein